MVSGGCGWAGRGSTALILGDTREAPRYVKSFGADASRKWITMFRGYCECAEGGNQTGVAQRDFIALVQSIPGYVQRVLAGRQANGAALGNDQLPRAMTEHAG